mgnify:FL=1
MLTPLAVEDCGVDPLAFTVRLLHYLGPFGVECLERQVRASGPGGVNGTTFFDVVCDSLAYASRLPGTCGYPWVAKQLPLRRNASSEHHPDVTLVGAAAAATPPASPWPNVRLLMSDAVFAHYGINFTPYSALSEDPFHTQQGAQIVKREARLASFASGSRSLGRMAARRPEGLDDPFRKPDALKYAIGLLCREVDVRSQDRIHWEDLVSLFAAVSYRGMHGPDAHTSVVLPPYDRVIRRSMRLVTDADCLRMLPSEVDHVTAMRVCEARGLGRVIVQTSTKDLWLLEGNRGGTRLPILTSDRAFGTITSMEYLDAAGLLVVATTDSCVRFHENITAAATARRAEALHRWHLTAPSTALPPAATVVDTHQYGTAQRCMAIDSNVRTALGVGDDPSSVGAVSGRSRRLGSSRFDEATVYFGAESGIVSACRITRRRHRRNAAPERATVSSALRRTTTRDATRTSQLTSGRSTPSTASVAPSSGRTSGHTSDSASSRASSRSPNSSTERSDDSDSSRLSGRSSADDAAHHDDDDDRQDVSSVMSDESADARRHRRRHRSTKTGRRRGAERLAFDYTMIASANTSAVNTLALLPNRLLVIGCEDGAVRTVDRDAPHHTHNIQTLATLGAPIRSLAYNELFDLLAIGSNDATPRIMVSNDPRCAPLRLEDSLLTHCHPVTFLHWCLGGPRLLSGDAGGVVKVWDIRRLGCLETIQTDGSVGLLHSLAEQERSGSRAQRRLIAVGPHHFERYVAAPISTRGAEAAIDEGEADQGADAATAARHRVGGEHSSRCLPDDEDVVVIPTRAPAFRAVASCCVLLAGPEVERLQLVSTADGTTPHARTVLLVATDSAHVLGWDVTPGSAAAELAVGDDGRGASSAPLSFSAVPVNRPPLLACHLGELLSGDPVSGRVWSVSSMIARGAGGIHAGGPMVAFGLTGGAIFGATIVAAAASRPTKSTSANSAPSALRRFHSPVASDENAEFVRLDDEESRAVAPYLPSFTLSLEWFRAFEASGPVGSAVNSNVQLPSNEPPGHTVGRVKPLPKPTRGASCKGALAP